MRAIRIIDFELHPERGGFTVKISADFIRPITHQEPVADVARIPTVGDNRTEHIGGAAPQQRRHIMRAIISAL